MYSADGLVFLLEAQEGVAEVVTVQHSAVGDGPEAGEGCADFRV